MRACLAALLLLAAAAPAEAGAAPSAPNPAASLPVVVQPAPGGGVTLVKGGQKALNFPDPVTRIVVTDGAVIDAAVFNNTQVRLTALKTGRTSVSIFTSGAEAAYTVNVVPEIGSVRALLAGDPALRGASVSFDGDRAVLTGMIANLQAHGRAIDALRAYFGDSLIDMTQIGGERMVAVEIRFAAVQADTLKELGFRFGDFGHGFSVATSGPSSVSSYAFSKAGLSLSSALPLADAFNLFLASPNSNLLTVLSALSQASVASILAEPTLMVRSGDHAEFLAGGEVPIPVPQAGAGAATTVTIEYHPYGVRLQVAPVVLADDRIALTVSPEVSEIDTANALAIQGYNVPAFRRRSTSTTIELADGQSFVLAGLIYSNSTVTEAKVPGLGDLPIIGSFFRYSRNARSRQELVIVATPHLVAPIARGTAAPPLPGEEFTRAYDPSPADMLLNRRPLDAAVAQHGLMP